MRLKSALLPLIVIQSQQSWCYVDQLSMLHLIYRPSGVCITRLSIAMFFKEMTFSSKVQGSTINTTQAECLSTLNMNKHVPVLYKLGGKLPDLYPEGCHVPFYIRIQPLWIYKISKVNMLISPLKHLPHPTVSTCSLWWTAVVGTNSFSKMYVYARCFV
jgi:hypothetical protein